MSVDCERLVNACEIAKGSLSLTQKRTKQRFDRKASPRSFKPGDMVLVPIASSALSARFLGPYPIKQKLSETDYVVLMPDRKRQLRVCHINRLKRYYVCDVSENGSATVPKTTSVASVVSCFPDVLRDVDKDGLRLRHAPQESAQLCNTEMLMTLSSSLAYLDAQKAADMVFLVNDFPCLFSDVPSCKSV